MSSSLCCDVLVAGGGAAGLAAAVAAGRAGARVVLLERYGFLGGLATAAEVGTICGLYLRDTKSAHPTLISGGFIRDFAARLQYATAQAPMKLEDGLWVLPFKPLVFARVADELVKESGSIRVLLHATAADVHAEDARVRRVRLLVWNEPVEIEPHAVVDCTGEATIAALAGAAMEGGAADQVPALVFTLDHVEPGLIERGLLEVRRVLHQAVASGALPPVCEKLALVPGGSREDKLVLKLNLALGAAPEPADWERVTSWEREARWLVHELQRFLAANVPSCRNAQLASIAPQLGTRSGRRIRGRAALSDSDVASALKSPMGIARGAWPMEQWGNGLRPEMAYLGERDYYDIPLDCLRPAGLENLLVAGRCLSAAPKAISSARVIGTALQTGWAAGTVAAFVALNRPVEEALRTVHDEISS